MQSSVQRTMVTDNPNTSLQNRGWTIDSVPKGGTASKQSCTCVGPQVTPL